MKQDIDAHYSRLDAQHQSQIDQQATLEACWEQHKEFIFFDAGEMASFLECDIAIAQSLQALATQDELFNGFLIDYLDHKAGMN